MTDYLRDLQRAYDKAKALNGVLILTVFTLLIAVGILLVWG